MKLTLFCTLLPRQHIDRVEEINRLVQTLGWEGTEIYGIIIEHVGYDVYCSWWGEKESAQVALQELAQLGIAAHEILICPRQEEGAVHQKRRLEGYYDDHTIHA